MNAIIQTLLLTLGYPVEHLDYDGSESSYFVWNYADDRGADYADDAPNATAYYLQIHFYCPKAFDHVALKTQVRDLLFSNDFSYPTIQTLYESDTRMTHIVWECEYVAAREV